ncbi:hypothetical protein ACFE04_021936 [Oxalis oulophora]
MAGGFMRNAAVIRRSFKQHPVSYQHRRIYNNINTTNPTIPKTQTHSNSSRSYLSDLFKRSSTNNNTSTLVSTYVSSSSSSSSTSTTTSGFVGWYLGMIKSHPVFTKSVTSSLIYVAADLSSQTIGKTFAEPYDLVRTSRMAGYGMFILGPSLHFWFNFMSKTFPKRDLITTFKKMAMGQGVYGPIMTTIFFSMNAALQGENGAEIVARLKRDLVPALVNGVMYWPICDFITFRFVPVQLQPLVSNSFSYVWTIYMTYMASLDKAEAALI